MLSVELSSLSLQMSQMMRTMMRIKTTAPMVTPTMSPTFVESSPSEQEVPERLYPVTQAVQAEAEVQAEQGETQATAVATPLS